MTEVWRDIPGIEGYQASNEGRLRSLERKVRTGPGGKATRVVAGQILKPFTAKTTGYLQVKIGGKKISAHRLVAFAWCEGFFEGAVVDHVNGIRDDNRPENLNWVTQSENQARSFRNGRLNHFEGKFSADHPTSKPVISRCLRSGQETIWPSGMDAVRAGFESSCITRCCQGKQRHHKGYEWRWSDEARAA